MIEEGESGWRVTCDRCESTGEPEGESGSFILPGGWDTLDGLPHSSDWPDLLDLCPSCVKSFKEWLNGSKAK